MIVTDEMWIAKDNNGVLSLFIGNTPHKFKYLWATLTPSFSYILEKGLFTKVKWSDDEPTKVKLVIDK